MASPARSERRAPAWDAPITLALLAVGLLNATQTVATARDLPASLDALYVAQDIGRYTSIGLATTIGWLVVAETLLSLVLAIGFAVPRIRWHRSAFWIPLLAGAISALLTVVLITVAILADPAYVASLQHT